MDQQEQLTKKERRELKVQERIQAQRAAEKKRHVKKAIRWVLWSLAAAVAIGGIAWAVYSQPKLPESEIASRSGLHWHPQLTIYVKGEKLDIPANIGIGAVHRPIHTHDDSNQGIIHMEFSGLVKKEDMTLGEFFKTWGREMSSFGIIKQMKVNGQANTEYENYVMQDNDNIELFFD